MIIKNFEGTSIKDVMRKVRKELGPEAVILATQERQMDGSPTKLFEVKAGAPTDSRIEGASKGGPILEVQALRGISSQLERCEGHLQGLYQNAATQRNLQLIEGEMKELKLIMLNFIGEQKQKMLGELSPPLQRLCQDLELMDLDRSVLGELIAYLRSIPQADADEAASPDRDESYRAHAMRWMLKRIKIAPEIKVDPGKSAFHAFVGPTGTGKTTLVAKLAARLKKVHQAKVLLVGFDNSKVGALDQLRIYAKVLDLPFVALGSATELSQRVGEHRDCDIVLIDTAGISPRNEAQLAELRTLFELPLPVDAHLVLSMTEKGLQLDQSVRNFSTLGVTSLAFTKLDETWTYGELFNLNHKWSIPLSYFSTGQGIPSDLERATRERVIERLFKI